MSRRKSRRCGRKTRFRDEYEAQQVLDRAQRKSLALGTIYPQRYYWHGKCQGFHITSQPEG